MDRALLTAFTLAALVALLAAERWRPRAVWLAKPLASLGFILVGLAGGTEARYAQIILAGLVLGAIGDVLLIPKSKPAFLGGLVSFLLGHVAYAIAFYDRGLAPGATLGAAALLTLVALAVGRWLLGHVSGGMKGPVLAYIVVISSMVAFAAGTVSHAGKPAILIGAVMFFASDLAVARNRFVQAGFSNKLWGLPLYYGGQLVIAWTI